MSITPLKTLLYRLYNRTPKIINGSNGAEEHPLD